MVRNKVTGFIKQNGHRGTVFVVTLILCCIFAVLYIFNLSAIPFKDLSDSKILEIVMSMFVVSVFMERAIEAFLVPVRTPDRQKIEQEIERLSTAEPVNAEKLQKKKQELAVYKLHTARRAYWLSFTFGLAVSFAGVRALSGLVDFSKLPELNDLHRTIFSFVDVLITGGVISGGSAAVDKMGRSIRKALNLTSATDSRPL